MPNITVDQPNRLASPSKTLDSACAAPAELSGGSPL